MDRGSATKGSQFNDSCIQSLLLHNLDSLTCYIHNHIVLDYTLPGTEHMLTIVFICCVLQKEE
jgi:hypothetical protein